MSLFVNDMETVDKVLSIVCQEINYDPSKNTYDPRMKEHMNKYRQNLKIK